MRPDGPRPEVVGPDAGPEAPFPLRLDGKVIKGFGRGSKELGIPTANIPIEGLSVGGHDDLESGVYYGWAGLSSAPTPTSHTSSLLAGKPSSLPSATSASPTHAPTAHDAQGPQVLPMVMSIGWNPFYKNAKRSVEVHVLVQFPRDFYGAHMNLIILGFIRPEYDYEGVEALVDDIRTDCVVTGRCLQREAYKRFKDEVWLRSFPEGRGEVAS